jgi:hypothetical protein
MIDHIKIDHRGSNNKAREFLLDEIGDAPSLQAMANIGHKIGIQA